MSQAPPKRKSVTLDDALIGVMYVNPIFTGNFPAFQPLATALKKSKKSGCLPCQRKNGNPMAEAYNNIKRFFAGLDSVQSQKLRALLNTERIIIFYKSPDGLIRRQELA